MGGDKDRLLGSVQTMEGASAMYGKPSFLRPLIFALIAALGPLAFGFTLGFTSPYKFDEPKSGGRGEGLTHDQNSLFGSMVNVGAMVGALIGGLSLDLVGRRRTMLVSMVPFTTGYLLIKFTTVFYMMLAGRILTGVGVGLVSLCVPVYISEIAPTHLRGGLGVINQLAVTLGVLIAYAIGMVVGWRDLAIVGAIIPAVLGLLSFFIPASPRWLFKRGRSDAAAAALERLRGSAFVIDGELGEIDQAVREDAANTERVSPADLFRGAAGRAMVVGAGLMIFQQFSGVNAVIFYSGSIFTAAGFSNANTASLIVSGVQVVVTGLSCFVVDKSGRRSLLMAAGVGMSASTGVLGYYFYQKQHDADVSGTIALVSVIVYVACFSFGLGAIPWLMMSEIFPVRVRGLASSFATMLNWSCSFLVTETFASMNSSLTEAGTFWFYGGVCLLGVAFVLFYVPETKGRSLEEIERFFNGDKNAGNQHVDGAGTGGATVQVAAILALIFVGGVLLAG